MAVYKVKLGSADGSVVERVMRGSSADDLRQGLTREGYFVFQVTPTFDVSSLIGFRKQIKPKAFIIFNREFRGLIKAGLPVLESLDVLLKRMKASPLRTVIEDVREQIVKGKPLSEAFAAVNDRLPRHYPALLRAGEQSGNLVEVLDRFIAQEERSRKARKKFRQALTYPILLIALGVVCMYIILTRALPQFMSFYTNSGKELPMATQVVISISTFIMNYHTALIIGLIVAIVAFLAWVRTDSGARSADRMLSRVPLVGTLWRLNNRNIFARLMRLLLNGGIALPDALKACSEALPSRELSEQLRDSIGEVMTGKTFHEALESQTRLDDNFLEMVRLGETTGSLEEMLEYLAEYGEEQAEDLLELISSLVAPLVLIFIGLMITFMVLGVYLPMFGSYEALGDF
jgi:type IV pilus assembly protein PilC